MVFGRDVRECAHETAPAGDDRANRIVAHPLRDTGERRHAGNGALKVGAVADSALLREDRGTEERARLGARGNVDIAVVLEVPRVDVVAGVLGGVAGAAGAAGGGVAGAALDGSVRAGAVTGAAGVVAAGAGVVVAEGAAVLSVLRRTSRAWLWTVPGWPADWRS